ncbi:TRAP transporter small permease subunit, partial [Micromonospora sp. NPDC051296]|uniref:TRAP transporter small permease n=1 Tax=Micromonospora sp. NPDC051296 TaxID=3155046 RepID=UPI00343F018F
MTTDETPPAADSPPDAPARRREPRILRVWASVELGIACAALGFIFLSVLWQVLSRYVKALNWPGAGELANFSLIVLTFIMVGYLVGNNGHITIQIIDYVAKGRALVVVKVLSAVLTAVICGALAWEAYALVEAYPTRRTA